LLYISQLVQSILGTPSFDVQRKGKLYAVETKKGNLGSLSRHSKAGLISALMFTLAPLFSRAEKISGKVDDVFITDHDNLRGELLQDVNVEAQAYEETDRENKAKLIKEFLKKKA